MSKKITLLLDLDGVLITTPVWKPDVMHADGYADFNKNCVDNLNLFLQYADFDIWLSSTRRVNMPLARFNRIFKRREIAKPISGYVPIYDFCTSRLEEIEAFIPDKEVVDYLILEDDKSMHGFKNKDRLVMTEFFKGFNSEKLEEARRKIDCL